MAIATACPDIPTAMTSDPVEITAKAYFPDRIDPLAMALLLEGLPDPIRPVYFTEDEGRISKQNRLEDRSRFEGCVRRNSTGFFLYSENRDAIDISVAVSDSGYSCVSLYLEKNQPEDLAISFLRYLAPSGFVYGLACDFAELEHRNQFRVRIGITTLERFVGRDLGRYIPGLYWVTVLSHQLLERHGVPLAELEREAVCSEGLDREELHLLKFFDHAAD